MALTSAPSIMWTAVTMRSCPGVLAKATVSPSSSIIWTSSSPALRPGRVLRLAPTVRTLLLPHGPAPPAPPWFAALARHPVPPPRLLRPQVSSPRAPPVVAAASAPRGAAARAPLAWSKSTATPALAGASCMALTQSTSIMSTLLSARLLPRWPSTTRFDLSIPGGAPAMVHGLLPG
jgi:hypothetical protein